MRKTFGWLCLVVLLSGLGGVALGQTVTAKVTGEVFHPQNRPAVNCVVRIDGRFDFVDGNGSFRIFKVPTGKQTLRVTCGKAVLMQEPVTIHAPVDKLPKIVLPH
jgi:hypothetical protein